MPCGPGRAVDSGGEQIVLRTARVACSAISGWLSGSLSNGNVSIATSGRSVTPRTAAMASSSSSRRKNVSRTSRSAPRPARIVACSRVGGGDRGRAGGLVEVDHAGERPDRAGDQAVHAGDLARLAGELDAGGVDRLDPVAGVQPLEARARSRERGGLDELGAGREVREVDLEHLRGGARAARGRGASPAGTRASSSDPIAPSATTTWSANRPATLPRLTRSPPARCPVFTPGTSRRGGGRRPRRRSPPDPS